jgi:hypothetical protein
VVAGCGKGLALGMLDGGCRFFGLTGTRSGPIFLAERPCRGILIQVRLFKLHLVGSGAWGSRCSVPQGIGVLSHSQSGF